MLNAVTNVVSATNALPVGLTTNVLVFNYTTTNQVVSNSIVQINTNNFYNYPSTLVPYQAAAVTTNATFFYNETVNTVATTTVTNYVINSDNTFTWLTSTTVVGPVTNLNCYATNYLLVTNLLAGQTVSGNLVSLSEQLVYNYALTSTMVTNAIFSAPVTTTLYGNVSLTNSLAVSVPAYNTLFSNSATCMIPQSSYLVTTNISCTFSNNLVSTNFYAGAPQTGLTNGCFATSAGWSFSSGAGVFTGTDGSLFKVSPAWGAQAAYLHGSSYISQTFTNPVAGVYQLSYAMAAGTLPIPANTIISVTLDSGPTISFGFPPAATNLIINPNFAVPGFTNGSEGLTGISIPGGWTGSGGGVFGVDANSLSWYTTPAPFAGQAAFLQQGVTVSQTVSVPFSGTYALSTYAEDNVTNAGTSGGIAGLIMQVDGKAVGAWAATNLSLTAWLPYYSSNFFLAAGSHVISLTCDNSLGGNRTVSVQNVQLTPLGITNYYNPAPLNLVVNPNFTGSAVNGGFMYTNAIPGGWSVTAGGVEDIPGAFFNTTPPLAAPTAFLQGGGSSVSQTVLAPVGGSYGISFYAEGRAGVYGPDGLTVTVDGVSVAQWSGATFSQTSWQTNWTPTFSLTASNHLISVVGYDDLGGDRSTAIQNVQLYQTNAPGSGLPVLVASSLVYITNNLAQPAPGNWLFTITNSIITQTNLVGVSNSLLGNNLLVPTLSTATYASASLPVTNYVTATVPPDEVYYPAGTFGLFMAGQTNYLTTTQSQSVALASFTNFFPVAFPVAVYTNSVNYTRINLQTNINALSTVMKTLNQTNYVTVLNSYLLTPTTNIVYTTYFNHTLGMNVVTTNVFITAVNVLQQVTTSTNIAPPVPAPVIGTGSTNQTLNLLVTTQPVMQVSNYPITMAVSNYVIASVTTNLDAVVSPANLRLIVFSGTNGTSSLLQQVFYGLNPAGNPVVSTTQNSLDPNQYATARRISAVHLPWTPNNTPYPFTGGVLAQGAVLTTTVDEPYDDQAGNPFLHTYHPDHNNLDLTQNPPRELARGVQSYEITRTITLTVEPTATDFVSLTTASTALAGLYNEVITVTGLGGAAKNYYTQGLFSLTQISPIPTLTTH